MLTPMDDYQCHQTPDTIDHAATQHPAFYERYWFVFGNRSGDRVVSLGMGAYPNRQIVDGFAICAIDGREQRNIRVSRDADADRERNWVGPLRVEVIEGLKRLRATADVNAQGFGFDIVFEGLQPPWERLPDFSRHRGNVLHHTSHLNQTGTARGTLTIDGVTSLVEPGDWYATRDRSWGIRPADPSVQAEPRAERADWFDPTGTLWQFIFVQWPDARATWQQRSVGDRISRRFSGAWIAADRSTPIARMAIRHIEYRRLHGDLRRFVRGEWEIEDADGHVRVVTARSLAAISLKGGGYHGYKGFVHGAWRGPYFEDGERWDLTGEAGQREFEFAFCHEHWCRFECEGREGYGIVEISDTPGCLWMSNHQPERLTVSG